MSGTFAPELAWLTVKTVFMELVTGPPSRWIVTLVGGLAASLLAFIGHPAYGPDALRADLDRFTFLLGGSDGEDLFGHDE
jgi:hypothetical protein